MPSSILTKSVCNAMQRIVPPVLAGSWGDIQSPVKNATVAANCVLLTQSLCSGLTLLSITPAVCDEAISHGASMIVSYHTPIFSGLKSLTMATLLQGTLLRCAAVGISIYSPHSALDSVFGGINNWLAKCIGAEPQQVAFLETKPAIQAIGGEGRRVTFHPPISMEVLEGRIKKNLSLSQTQFGSFCVY
ncbi:GTP cyclohydrolase 1 type 2/Nif3 [Mycena epipterygia]|nr:GTP cyclohydrolase 1 type 2/Nif3 [Mycena epipterygia]